MTPDDRRSARLLVPLLPGARPGDRLLACLGAAAGIALAAGIGVATGIAGAGLPLVVAPMGASAVLIFAVPASPLAQPWPVVGGNVLSALVGVGVAQLLGHGALAAGLAVGLAILVMSLARCLHPPGGAAALTAVVGGPAVWAAGWQFALVTVAAGALALLVAGLIFHRLSGHRYPHRPPAQGPALLHPDDIDAALGEMGEAFDIARDDLDALLQRAEAHARRRR